MGIGGRSPFFNGDKSGGSEDDSIFSLPLRPDADEPGVRLRATVSS